MWDLKKFWGLSETEDARHYILNIQIKVRYSAYFTKMISGTIILLFLLQVTMAAPPGSFMGEGFMSQRRGPSSSSGRVTRPTPIIEPGFQQGESRSSLGVLQPPMAERQVNEQQALSIEFEMSYSTYRT